MTAARLVQRFGDSVLEVMDGKGATAALTTVSGIGATQASRIKAAWDASRGAGPRRAVRVKGSCLGGFLGWRNDRASTFYVFVTRCTSTGAPE